ncbi:phosphotransferase family protein [Roseovarius sp.]|uniref:phosphotransferase family protein n=1 Tax=Roseovarius sp. TaxID=1486281 RepID=UPI003568A634
MLPERPVRAALAGLALYETRKLRQRALVLTGRLSLSLRLGALMRAREWPAAVNTEWWHRWLADVAEPAVGRIERIAMSLFGDRQTALLMDHHGRPLGFSKVWPGRKSYSGLENETAILKALEIDPPLRFRTPRILAHGVLNDHVYQLFTPLPEGRQRHPPPDPGLIASVIDEVQAKLAALPKPADSPAHHVMGHGDFTLRNLRLAADRNLWIFDWEYAGWTPRLADEIRYWATWYATRLTPQIRRDSARMLRLLRSRGTDREILEAVCWPEHSLRTEQALRDAIRAEVEPHAKATTG